MSHEWLMQLVVVDLESILSSKCFSGICVDLVGTWHGHLAWTFLELGWILQLGLLFQFYVLILCVCVLLGSCMEWILSGSCMDLE